MTGLEWRRKHCAVEKRGRRSPPFSLRGKALLTLLCALLLSRLLLLLSCFSLCHCRLFPPFIRRFRRAQKFRGCRCCWHPHTDCRKNQRFFAPFFLAAFFFFAFFFAIAIPY